MVNLFKALANDDSLLPGFEFVSAYKYVSGQSGQGDVPWLEAFAADGGNAVISGDVSMRKRPHERQAYRDAGLVMFFFQNRWGNLTLFPKSAMLLKWWPRIEDQLRISEPKQCWEIPAQWMGGEMREVTGPND